MKLGHVAKSYIRFFFISYPFLFVYSVAELKNFKNYNSNGYFLFGNPVPFHRYQLNSSSNILHEVAGEEDCLLQCINTSNCQSVNFKVTPEDSGKFLCYLLDVDKFIFPQLFDVSNDFHHYSFTSPCQNAPCLNGGTCYPVSGRYDFKCTCPSGLQGKHCSISHQSCVALLNAGYILSGVYRIKPRQSEALISVYCDQFSRGGGWTMVFKLVSGVSTIPHELWTSSNSLNEDKPEALNTKSSLKAHYKNHMVANWQTVDPAEARVALYTGGSEDFSIVFNSTGSDNINWFSETRVTNSPWTDFNTEPHYHFSIEGCCDSRDFYIVRNHGGCHADAGWLATTSANCDWENRYPKTTILYSKLGTYSSFSSSENLGTADVVVVYIR